MSIPVVDLADFLSGDAAKKASFVKALGTAYETVGFVAVKNHGIPDQLIAAQYDQVQQFFSLPLEKKLTYQIDGLAGQRGYTSFGTEHGITKGLGWVKGEVNKIEEINFRVPHLGWNNLISIPSTFTEEFHNKDFYFIHSYHFEVENIKNIAAYVNYGKNYVAAVHNENIFATQFHPEKSHSYGIKLLDNFSKL